MGCGTSSEGLHSFVLEQNQPVTFVNIPIASHQNHSEKPGDSNMDQTDIEKTKDTEPKKGTGNESKTAKPEPDPEMIKEHFSKLSETLKDKELLDSDGNFIPAVRKCTIFLSTSYFAMKHLPLAELIEFRILLGSMMVELKLLDICCEVIIHTYPSKWIDDEGKAIRSKFDPLRFALLTVANFSDASDEIAVAAANIPNLLETLTNILVDYLDDHLKSTLMPEERQKVLRWSHMIIHNLSMSDSNIGRLRALKCTEVLQPYLRSPVDMTRLSALASLAGIVDEKESEIINANQDQVKQLFEALQKGLGNENRRHNGWSCKESALTIRQLAQNDANKCLLVKLGALELLVELGKTGDQAEQYESVQAIWALTFDKENQKKIANSPDLGVIELLLDLKGCGNDRIKKACNGALWNLEEDMKTSSVQKYKQIAEEVMKSSIKKFNEKKKNKGKTTKDEGHIMISYQWADQKMLIRVRDSLKAAGLKVWMDIDQMGGSTLQAMAEAVENASIVLVCMSHKYKNSPNCRAEAEYAYQKQKKIIPLKLERGYIPDGWLGFIAGAKLFFEFSDKYPFDQKLNGLLKEIKGQSGNDEEVIKPDKASPVYTAGPTAVDEADCTPAFHSAAMTTTHTSKAMLLKVRKWNQTDVQNWVNRNDLKLSAANTWTGSEIALMLKMSTEAPEFFYKFLNDNLKISDLQTMSKVVWALDDLKDEL